MAAQGTVELDFGAFPGASDASVAVASAGIASGSLVEAWIFPAATADHTIDEHTVETIAVRARDVVAGVGFTIYGWNTNNLNEPVVQALASGRQRGSPGTGGADAGGGRGTRLYGRWNVAWVWNT